MAIHEGQSFGNYKVLSRLGVGGMGAVYLAEHPLIGKKVALKAIHKEFAHNKEVVARFFNEARAVNKIGNEHIVEIHDFGQGPDGEHFFIMEYLQGPTLAEVLQHERVVNPQRALHIAAQIASGLAAAHACGIIHRDLKPDNIMLVPRLGDKDFVKILDFGLAKMFADASSKLTAQGVVLGTPQYMAPEACESKQDIDHRADIYALGVLMFQMLCGQVPFDGNTMGEVLVKHVGQPPPAPRGFNPAIPPSVEQIILRCLAKKRDDRFPTMKDLRAALLDSDRYLASSPPVMPSASSSNAKTVFGKSGEMGAQPPPAAASKPRSNHPRPGTHRPPPPSAATVAPGFAGAPPLGAPPPSAPPPLVAAAGDPAKTVMLGDNQPLPLAPPPPSIPSAPAPAIASAQAKTQFIPGDANAPISDAPANGNGGIPSAGAAAKTAFFDESVSIGEAPAMPQRTMSAVPDMNPPAAPVNATMVIGTPPGYSDKPPRKSWPIVVGLVSVVAIAGAGVAAFVFPGFLNKKSKDDDTTATATIDAGVKKPAPEPKKAVAKAKPRPVDAGAEKKEPGLVAVQFKTVPSGAEIYDKDNHYLGKTPCEVKLLEGKAHVLTLKHKDAKTRTKTVVASPGLEMVVDMEVVKKRRRYYRRRRRTTPKHTDPTPKTTTVKKRKVGDGVQDPDF